MMIRELWVRAESEAGGNVLHDKAELTTHVPDQATRRKRAAASRLTITFLQDKSTNVDVRHILTEHCGIAPFDSSVALRQVQDFFRDVVQAHLPAYRSQTRDDDLSEESLNMISGIIHSLAAHLLTQGNEQTHSFA